MTEYKSEFSGKQIDEAVGWAQTNRSVNLQELQKEVSGKQEALRTGTGIKLKGNVISVDESVPTLEDLNKEESERMAADLLRPTKSEVDAMLATAKELLFRDMWNMACNAQSEKYALGRYNEATGYYECNGITDLTYEEALLIYNFRIDLKPDMTEAFLLSSKPRLSQSLRTNIFTNNCASVNDISIDRIVVQSDIEVLCLQPSWRNVASSLKNTRSDGAYFASASKLQKIIGILSWKNFVTANITPFGSGTTKLESFTFKDIQCNVSMVNQPNITCESILYMIENRSGSNPITWQVHADVFNRCADYEVSEEYPNIIDYALIKYNITIGIV